MLRHPRNLIFIIPAIVLLSACNHLPDHARYIPKDAVAVAGINLKALGKKIAWNVITGSKLFKEMQDRIAEKNSREAISGIEKAGIDFTNTIYVYVKTDNRFKGGNRITGLVPLSDAAQWEAYVKQAFPKAEIKQNGNHKEASLGKDMYVGWNKKLMIVINVMPTTPDYSDFVGGNAKHQSSLDMSTISAEMDNAFSVPNGNSITGNKHFTTLEMEGHDVTFILNYEQVMSQMSGEMAEKMGLSLTASPWKDAAFTSGFDFVKGKISGEMRLYLSDEMKDIGKEILAENANNDMLDRLPHQNLDMLLAMHLSPKGLKASLEKMNLLGMANAALSTQELSVDTVLDAFTGDMAIVMNDFSLHTEKVTDYFMGQPVVHDNQKPSVNVTYAIKINKSENFQKLVKFAKDNGMPPMGNGFVIPIDTKDSVYIMINNQFAVASNNFTDASGFLKGNINNQKMPEATSARVYGHPISFYLDIQQLFKNIDPGINNSAHDSAIIAESKKLLNNISFTGGEYKNDNFEYHLDINFMNTEENSIINLMDYGMKMSDADKIKSNGSVNN